MFLRSGWEWLTVARIACKTCRHVFQPLAVEIIGMFVIEMVEYAAFMYLRAISFNSILAVLRAWYEKRVLAKNILITHIEQLADRIPGHQAVSAWLQPRRSGYYAIDGTWLKYRGKDIVLLIILDVVTLDLVGWQVAQEEDETSHRKLVEAARGEIAQGLRGFYCDGDLGLLAVLRETFHGAPIQLCVFHKYSRMSQIIPFVRVRKPVDREIKARVEAVLFAGTKDEAEAALLELEYFAKEHHSHRPLQKLIRALKWNFDLLLTHFDHPEMSPYNNMLEGFNHVLKRRLRLMKGFKKPINITRWLKLILTDWRFHILRETAFKERRGKSPLQLAGVQLPEIFNWMSFVRKNYSKIAT